MSGTRDITEIRQLLRAQLPLLSARYGVVSLALFGSSVRGQARADSDLDVLVRFQTAPSLLRLVELENYLSDILEMRVDLVMADSLKPHIGRRILEEAVSV